MNLFVAIICLGLFGLSTTTAYAQTARTAPAVAFLPAGSLSAAALDQGERPAAQTTPQNPSEPPVKAVPPTGRKSKPQRVDDNGEAVEAPAAPATARSARPERSARGSRASEGVRGARGAGGVGAGAGRALGAGRGRGH